MLDPAIQAFLDERKEARIKAKSKAGMSELETLEIQRSAEHAFALETWLPDAANRAKQLSMVSHPGKFTHPGAKISPLIASSKRSADGFLRTGNVETELDVFGNAAALDVYRLLSLEMRNGKSVLQNLEQKSEEIQQQFTLKSMSFDDVYSKLMAIKKGAATEPQTSTRIKQVYFPIGADYHLLSLLTPSGLMFKLKQRINEVRFSDQAKQAREAKRKNDWNEQGFSELYDLTVIGFGGTKPQNISVKNNQNYGQAYLLQSLPPVLKTRSIQAPKTSFFRNTLNPWKFKDSFQSFHQFIIGDYNNMNIRKGRDKTIQFIISQAIDRMWMLRQLEAGWSQREGFERLPHYQKIWLDQQFVPQRSATDDWLEKVMDEMAIWFLHSYQKVIGDKARKMGAEHLPHIRDIITDNREGLK